MMKKLALVDVDGTLVMKTNVPEEGYENVAPFGEKFWEIWNEKTADAEVLVGGVEMVKKLKEEGHVIVIVTVRGGKNGRKVTIKKLKEIGVWGLVDHMYLRPAVCERWYWKKDENAVRNDWRKAKKWGSDEVKDYMIPIIEKKLGGKFVVAMEDENHAVMQKHGMVVIDAATWGGGQ